MYRIYNPAQSPRTDGVEYKSTASSLTQSAFDKIKALCEKEARKVCAKMGWNYSELLHEHTFNIIK